jgi:NAD(P)-dependent dehydrogenase (short-subunit alcohol dehydrogenase family)
MKPKAYVTGADRGLGLALTRNLIEQGYKVYAGSYMPDWHELVNLSNECSSEHDSNK